MHERRSTLLAIEDDPSYASLLRRSLERADPPCEVVAVPRLSEALDRLAEGGVDLVLLDLVLPGAQGLDALRSVLAAAPEVPVVVVTAVEDADLAFEAVRLGADDVLWKSRADASALATTVRLSLARRESAERRIAARVAREVRPRTDGERQRLLRRLAAAQEEERRRLAGNLHDDPIRELSSVQRGLEELATYVDRDESRLLLEDLHERVAGTTQRLRRMLFELRPTTLDREGLAAAIRRVLERDAEIFEVTVDDRTSRQPQGPARLALFRVAQEALENARRHSHAESIKVLLDERDGGFSVTVVDDGVGFDPDGALRPGHLGLVRLREQAELVGGWCRIESAPGSGTRVECWVPA